MAGEHIRNFAKFFTNLSTSQRQEMERTLADLENSKELMSLDSSLRQLRRNVDQRLPIPQLTIDPTVRGANISWEPLPDQRISFYEVDVSSTSNFAAFTTTPTFGISLIIDGLTSTKTVRVRGIRRDGTTTPYSDPGTVNPALFDIQSHAAENFYIDITGTDAVTVLGGDGTDLDYTPINPDGNSMVWGFISMYADPSVAMFGKDDIMTKIIKVVKSSEGEVLETTTEWQMSSGEYNNSQAIGPFHIAHPELNQSIELSCTVQDQTVKENLTARSADNTVVWWCTLSVLEIGST